MLSQNGSAIGLDLTEGDGSHSGSFKSEAESANAAEEVEDIHAAHRASRVGTPQAFRIPIVSFSEWLIA